MSYIYFNFPKIKKVFENQESFNQCSILLDLYLSFEFLKKMYNYLLFFIESLLVRNKNSTNVDLLESNEFKQNYSPAKNFVIYFMLNILDTIIFAFVTCK